MPREIVTTDGRSFRYREYQLPALGEREIRLRVEFAAPKHGTEAHALTGSVFGRKQPLLGAQIPRANTLIPRRAF